MIVLEFSLGFILLILAIAVILQNKPLKAVIISGAFSVSAAVAYFFVGAPDVAMAEASIGAVFTTFIYIVALKHSGRLRIMFVNVPGLMKKDIQGYEGVEYELLKLFAEDRVMDLEIREIDSFDSLEHLEDFDILCGGITEKTVPKKLEELRIVPYLDTNIFSTRKGEKFDLVRIKNIIMNGEISLEDIDENSREPTKYVFLISKESEDIGEALSDFLQNMDKETFDSIVRRNLG